MPEETPLPPVPPPSSTANQHPSIHTEHPMSNALGIWALVLSLTGCCATLGLILGIIGICKYPEGSSGRVLSIIATVISILIQSGGYIFREPLLQLSAQSTL